jgi:hypothetical protein
MRNRSPKKSTERRYAACVPKADVGGHHVARASGATFEQPAYEMPRWREGPQECRRGNTVSVELADLQDMQNHMRETIGQGMVDLHSHKGGLPAAPASAQAAPVKAAFAISAPPPEADVATQVKQQAAEADQAEKAVLSTPAIIAAAPAPVAPPIEISLVQTTEQVRGSLGTPTRIVDLGAKKIYVYKDIKSRSRREGERRAVARPYEWLLSPRTVRFGIDWPICSHHTQISTGGVHD